MRTYEWYMQNSTHITYSDTNELYTFKGVLTAYYLHQHVSVAVVTIFRVSLDKHTINMQQVYKMCMRPLQVYNKYGEHL